MRPRRRLSTRRPLRRVAPPTVVGAPGQPLTDSRPAHWRMRCMCGTILEVDSADDGRRRTCETCNRRFDIHFTEDVSTGQKGVSLHYLSDGNRKSGETSNVANGTTIFEVDGGSPGATNPAGLLIEPELPDEAHFKCACGVLLAIPKKQYEKRSKCPACNARMLVFMLTNPSTGAISLQVFSLIDKSTGQTQILAKL